MIGLWVLGYRYDPSHRGGDLFFFLLVSFCWQQSGIEKGPNFPNFNETGIWIGWFSRMIVVYQWGVNGRSHRYRHGSAFRSLGGTPPYKKVENPPPDLYTQSYRQRERERESCCGIEDFISKLTTMWRNTNYMILHRWVLYHVKYKWLIIINWGMRAI